MEYKASKDKTVKAITAGTVILFAFLGYFYVMGPIRANGNMTLTLIYSGLIILLITTILFGFLYAPQKYSV